MELNLQCRSGDNGRQKCKRLSGSGKKKKKKEWKKKSAVPRQKPVCWRDGANRKRMKRKLLWRLSPNLFLSHSHEIKSLRQRKYINFYLIAEDTCKTPPDDKWRCNFCQPSWSTAIRMGTCLPVEVGDRDQDGWSAVLWIVGVCGGGVCDQFTGWHQCLVWGGKWNLSAASSVRKDGGQQTKTLLKGERQVASASL